VLVRKDLTYSSPAVQAGHSIAEFCLRSRFSMDWNNHILVYLQVENLKKLKNWLFKFEKRNIETSIFYEPDLNNEMTAFCALVNEENYGFLSSLDLLE
jgi:hypothetical protein